MSDPFEGRKKTYTGETLGEAKANLLKHRQDVHQTSDLEPFFDCAACGILDRRVASLEALVRKDKHPAGCNCSDCWEPRPLQGETMDDALSREFASELRLMDEKHLAIVVHLATQEQHRRHPLADIPMKPANIEEVKKLVKLLVDAFNKRIDDEENPLDFMDAFMGLVNFDRIVLEMIEDGALDLKTMERKRAFRSLFVASVSNSLMRRVMS